MRIYIGIGFLLLCIVAILSIVTLRNEQLNMKNTEHQLKSLTLSFGKVTKIPDPAQINTAGEWYLLNHISSPLVTFDHEKGIFLPLIAESWSISGNTYTFHIRKDARFHDGTPLKSADLVASIKRLMIKKTSSHFPIWEYVVGCEDVKTIDSECRGITMQDDSTVVFILRGKRESFFLQMASPEGGIWSAKDINPNDFSLTPTKFSGPYAVSSIEANGVINLDRNAKSFIQHDFPASPEHVHILPLGRADMELGLVEKRIDLFIGDYIPFNKFKWEQMPVRIHLTTPSSIIYLFGLKKPGSTKFSQITGQYMETLWGENTDPELFPAETFLPFGSIGAVTRAEFLSGLSKFSPTKKIRIAAPDVYFQDGFLNLLRQAAKSNNIELEINQLPVSEFFSIFEEGKEMNYDFALSTYVASERFPAVQLRFLLNGRKPPGGADTDLLDAPETDASRLSKIAHFQMLLLKSQMVLPLFFIRTHIIYQNYLNAGTQPITDADIQLWKFTAAE